MKKWTIESVTDTATALTIMGHHENKRSPRTQFVIVLEKNLAEVATMQIHRGRVVTADGTTEKTAARVASHLAATSQLREGVTVVA